MTLQASKLILISKVRDTKSRQRLKNDEIIQTIYSNYIFIDSFHHAVTYKVAFFASVPG